MSNSLEKYKKVQSETASGAIFLEDWNGLCDEVGAGLDELRARATAGDAAAQVAIVAALDRVNEVLAPSFALVNASAAQLEARLAELNGAGISAAAVNETGTRAFVTPEQRAKIDTAAQADTLAALAAAVSRFGFREHYFSNL